MHVGHALALLFLLVVADISLPYEIHSLERWTGETIDRAVDLALTWAGEGTHALWSILANSPLLNLIFTAWPLFLIIGLTMAAIKLRPTWRRAKDVAKKYTLLLVLVAIGFLVWLTASLLPETTARLTAWLAAEPATALLQQLGNWGLLAGAIIAFSLLIQFSRSRDERIEDEVARAWSILAIKPTTGVPTNTGAREALELLHSHGRRMNGIDVQVMVLDGMDLSRGSDRNRAELAGANFHGSSLKNAKFDNANLEDADLSITNGLSLSFKGTNLENARFDGCDFRQPDFADARYRNTKIRNAALVQMNSYLQSMSEIDFDGTKLLDVSFSFCEISDVGFNRCQLDLSIFETCQIKACSFSDATIKNTTYSGVISGVHFQKAQFSNVRFFGPIVEETEFWDTTFLNGKFENLQLRKCWFSGARMKRVQFLGCDIHDVDFTDADLTDASFAGSRIDAKTRFEKAILCGVDLSHLTEAALPNLKGAYFDSKTVVPGGQNPLLLGMTNIKHHERYRDDFSDREI